MALPLVTEVVSTTVCKIDSLKDYGDDFFVGDFLHVQRDAAGGGAAPQGQSRKITDYVSVDGTFTHEAFTTGLAVNDEVLPLHKGIAVELLSYNPFVQDTTDLEAATKTITATAEAIGVGNADYSKALTLPKPTGVTALYLEVLRIEARLAVTIDSMTAGTLYCRVYVDAQDADHRLFDITTWTTTGAKLSAVDTHAGALATIFALLKDGAAHTFYFFFWVDAGNAVISLVQLWEGVGTCSTWGGGQPILQFNFGGFAVITGGMEKIGTGAPYALFPSPAGYMGYRIVSGAGSHNLLTLIVLVGSGNTFRIYGTVGTDLNYIQQIYLNVRREV